MELSGRTALVTGAARRVGRAIALALAREGADVVVHYGRSAAEAEETAAAIRATGVRAWTRQADLARPEQVEALFAAVAADPGGLDVLVNNAAVFDPTPIDRLTAAAWDRQVAINARAPALCIRHALPLLRAGGRGAIVNVTDISAERPTARYPAYCASKAALLAVTRSAARALAGENVRVNAVAPGVALWADDADEARKRATLARVPLNRPGTPEDVAAAVVFLARHDYMTGQHLRVDGGWNMA